MVMNLRNYISAKLLLLTGCIVLPYINSDAQSVYNPLEAFSPAEKQPATATRAADGRPGSGYWQNRADYNVQVSFDTLTRTIQGAVAITYTNNSTQALTYIWLVSGQNRFRKDSRAALLTPAKGNRFGVQEYTAGCKIESLEVGATKRTLQQAAYQETDIYTKVLLPIPLLPGRKTLIRLTYHFQLPYNGSDYMGIQPTPHGAVYQLGSMFPRVVVYDDIQGWNVAGSGYFVEPGSLGISITVPAGLIVQGTGELKNPEEVLSPAQLQRYRAAWKSDSVITIRSAADIAYSNKQSQGGTRTWRFAADNAGDGIWGISSSFVWDAVRANLPNGRVTLAMALYPPESNTEWKQITGQMKTILETYSGRWTPYAYTTAVNIAGSITGVAAPGVTVIDYQKSSRWNRTWTKTNHEIGHSWFNMMVPADSKYGWMCEGLNTFINLINCDTLRGEPPFTLPDATRRLAVNVGIPALNTPAPAVRTGIMAMVMYIKPALALTLLRDKVIGREKFDPAFRRFISEWTFKHPAPEDFFRMMENETGEDLQWFWRSWFLNDWKLDQGITDVVYVNNDPAQGANITIVNRGKMVMPVDVAIREAGGKPAIVRFPAQVWQQDSVHTFHYASTTPLEEVILDPGNELPDTDRSNNAWKKR
ncbi:M1 family aminopeptidase [Chitinophaga sp. 180180018-2]|nr:M1 family aminopeptidase [Chitinophaga sp. 212800010-3]